MNGLTTAGISLVAGMMTACLCLSPEEIPRALDASGALFVALAQPIGRHEAVEDNRRTAHRRIEQVEGDLSMRMVLFGFIVSHFVLVVLWYGGQWFGGSGATPPTVAPVDDDDDLSEGGKP